MKNRGIAAAALAIPLLGAPNSQPISAAPFQEAAGEGSGALRVGGLLEASTVWSRYRERFVSPEGRVVDTGNEGISHSEGQGYGLLLAVAAADRPSFDRILSWTDQNLFVRDDHLAAWRWTPSRRPTSLDNNATDGDILIAWALAEAADFWREPAYLAQAKLIARDIVTELLKAEKPYGLVLSPAAKGFSAEDRHGGRVINLSYWVFPAFRRLEQLAPEAIWSGLEATGLSLIETARLGGADLPSDWSEIGAEGVAPAEGFPAGFAYNAVRIPLYAFWGGVAAPRLMRALTEVAPDIAHGFSTASFVEPGYRSIWSLARCAATGRPYPPEFYAFTAEQNYYPATLSALSLLAAAYRGGPCLDRAAMAEVLGGRQPTAASDLTQMDTSAVVLPTFARASPDGTVPPAAGPAAVEPPERVQAASAFAKGAEDRGTAPGELGGFLGALLGLALGGGAFAFHWRRRRERRLALESLVTPDPVRAPGELTLVSPRDLPINPYFTTASSEVLSHQIERAAAVSVELGRTLGIIYFRLGGPDGRKARTAKDEDELAELLAQFRGVLRKTDHVALVNDVEIVACISLLPGLTELSAISERLRTIGRASAKLGATFQGPAGLAVYPMCGYRAADLIEYARANYGGRKLAAEDPALPLAAPAPRRAARRRSRKKKLQEPSV